MKSVVQGWRFYESALEAASISFLHSVDPDFVTRSYLNARRLETWSNWCLGGKKMGLGKTRQPLPSLQTLDTFNQCKTMSAAMVNICLWLCFHSAEQVLGWVGTLLAVQGLRLCVHCRVAQVWSLVTCCMVQPKVTTTTTKRNKIEKKKNKLGV